MQLTKPLTLTSGQRPKHTSDSVVIMDRLSERKSMIVNFFSRQYEGRINHSMYSWADVGAAVSTYLDLCEDFEERRKRKERNRSSTGPKLPSMDVIHSSATDLLESLLAIIFGPGFPVSPIYEHKTVLWLRKLFEELSSERGLARLTSLDY